MSQISITPKVGSLVPNAAPKPPAQLTEAGKTSFDNVLSGMINEVNGLQGEAGALREQLLSGEAPDLHQIMIAGEKAGIAVELLVEVRNKLVEAYQELMRMPV